MNEKMRQKAKTPESEGAFLMSRSQEPTFSQPIYSPFDHNLFLQRAIGNQGIQRLVESDLIQAKIKVSQPNDRYEQEADRITGQVKRMPVPQIQQQSEEEEKKKEEKLFQTKGEPSRKRGLNPNIASRIESVKGTGQSLTESTRNYFEPRFGYEFDQVRLHTNAKAAATAELLNAKAFTIGRDIVFGNGQFVPDTPQGRTLLAHELTHVVQQGSKDRINLKKGEDDDTLSDDTQEVSIEEGESITPSDQKKMARGYKERNDGYYDTPDGRVIAREQAFAESQVINSKRIYMGAYLSRYNKLKKIYNLTEEELARLSTKAGFLNIFKTGDIVLRLMSAEDSQGLAKITDSNYSHSGIIQVKNSRVWVLDSYPSFKKTGESGDREESTILIPFEEFFSDQHSEKIVQGLVLRIEGLRSKIRSKINDLISFYHTQHTLFDYEFKIDNDKFVLYCSELVWRILYEAGSPVLPPNEFQFTKSRVKELIGFLELSIQTQKAEGTDTSKSEKQLSILKQKLNELESATTEELYSPGSIERTPGLKPVAGFTRAGQIEGLFDVIIVKGTLVDDSWDTPDSYVKFSAGFFGGSGQTSTIDDSTKPIWNEIITTLDYKSLKSITLELYDEDPISSDDLIETFTADLRPVRPKGQTFTLTKGNATIVVKVKGVDEGRSMGAFGPQAPRQEFY
ncbi:MAG: DUF4157 domain-containing protein [bacterium]